MNNFLFSRLMRISVRDCQQTKSETSMRSLSLLVELSINSGSGCSCECVIIRLSDQNDPFFLYVCTINEQLFAKIKESQNLLIDFNVFPQTLNTLLQTCFDEQNKENSRFLLLLSEMNTQSVKLEVVETNPFKHLIHFSISFDSANDSIIKSNVCSSYRSLKREKESLEKKLESIELQLNQITILNANELEKLKTENEFALNETKMKYNNEIKTKTDLIEDLMMKNKANNLEIEELKTKLLIYEQNLSEQSLKLDNELSKITQLNTQIKSLELDLDKVQHLLASNQNEKINIQSLFEQKQHFCDDYEKKIDSLIQDLTKANEIIRKLQNEVQSTNHKLDILNKVATKQDEIVGIKQSRLEKLEYDFRMHFQQMNIKNMEYQNLLKQFESLKQKYETSETQLNENKNLILCLNKQINELQSKHGIKSSINSVNGFVPSEDRFSKTDATIISKRNALFVKK